MTATGFLTRRIWQLAAPEPVASDTRAAGIRETDTGAVRRPLRIVVAGGGTGGHLFPGIAVAEEIRARSERNQVLFISRGNELERSALARAGFALATIQVEGFKGRGLWNQIRVLANLPAGLIQSLRHLADFRPDLVLGLGSYSAGPVVLAAWLRGIPAALCEQNTLPGVTNRALAPLAARIFTSFEQTGGGFKPAKVLWTGNPLRREIVAAAGGLGAAREILPEAPFTVLVVGGSQGAHRINATVTAALEHLRGRERFFFIHQTGAADEAMAAAAYAHAQIAARVQAFFTDMAVQYRQADLVVCRAGATTVAEIAALGKAALFIPFPQAADDHQRLNAQRLVAAGAADMILEQDLNAPLLAERIAGLAARPQALRAMAEAAARLGKPDAARQIVDECYRLVAGRLALKPADGSTDQRANGSTG